MLRRTSTLVKSAVEQEEARFREHTLVLTEVRVQMCKRSCVFRTHSRSNEARMCIDAVVDDASLFCFFSVGGVAGASSAG